jgi:class 3 adenylate cyclase
MTDPLPPGAPRFREPPDDGTGTKLLAPAHAGPDATRYAFRSRLEIGRDDGARELLPGLLLVPDPTVSRSHCVLTQRADGRCFVRDVSRNGTRVDGRRLQPAVETEVYPGQVLAVSTAYEFVLVGTAPARRHEPSIGSTLPHSDRCIVTVLVADIRDYATLVASGMSEEVQRSVKRVFEALSAAVLDRGGTVKEYQGDALLAFWEGDAIGKQALRACGAALALDALAERLAGDPAVWAVGGFPLCMNWALATGMVLIDSFGARHHPAGLSMMGEPVVRAFRIERFAGAETGRIVACGATRQLAEPFYAFRDLGERLAKGFDKPDRVYALTGPGAELAPPPG